MSSKIIETAYVDVSDAQNVAQMVFSLGQDLDSGEFSNKRIILNLGDADMNQSQLLSLKSIIEGYESEIDFIHSSSSKTKLAALNTGVSIANQKDGEYTKEAAQVEVISAQRDELLDALAPLSGELPKQLRSEVQDTSKLSPLKEMQYIEMEPEIGESQDVFGDSEETSFAQECREEMETTLEEPLEVPLKKEFILDENKKGGDTVYITQTIRSGQVASYDGNIVIIGDCHPGSEVVASGDITVWGVLAGIAHAGACGNESSVIRALKIDAIQLRIAKYFARRPDRENIEYAEKTDTFTPEEARVEDGGIYIYTLNNKN